MIEPDRPDRSIDLLLVTGAGASCPFGVGGARLPLMGDWVERLVQRLASSASGYLEATGLEAGMDPEAFERQLGAFLRSVEAFDRIAPLLDPIVRMSPVSGPRGSSDDWRDWQTSGAFQLEQVTAVIHESLYEQFGAPAIDTRAAAQAFRTLLGWFGLGATSSVVYATTNYDTITEGVIVELGGLPDAGDPQTSPSNTERAISVDGLLGGMPRYTPVLHLHGRVGWLRRRDGGAYSTVMQNYDRNVGVPIVMLPDLEKDYETDPLISAMWQQFEQALRRAERVFVLGHSLRDVALVRSLRDYVEPMGRLGVALLAADVRGHLEPVDREAAERLSRELPGAAVILMEFQAEMENPPATLREWLGFPLGLAPALLPS